MTENGERYCGYCNNYYFGYECPCVDDYMENMADDLYDREREPEYNGD